MARGDAPDLVLMDMSLPLPVERATGEAAEPLQGRLETVLVVDDDEANRNVLGRRLAKLG